MSDIPFDTRHMQRCVERWQAGERTAADDLLRAVGQRLEHLTRKMLSSLPALRVWVETGDVLQGSLIRLLSTLRKLRPNSTAHFFNLAAVHIRRELLDLARRFRSQRSVQLNPDGPGLDDQEDARAQTNGTSTADRDLDLWCRFHEAVEQLPLEEREVVGLVFYHGWTQVQVAELFQIDERTVRRRWQAACLRVNQLVGDELPPPYRDVPPARSHAATHRDKP